MGKSLSDRFELRQSEKNGHRKYYWIPAIVCIVLFVVLQPMLSKQHYTDRLSTVIGIFPGVVVFLGIWFIGSAVRTKYFALSKFLHILSGFIIVVIFFVSLLLLTYKT